MIHYAWVFSLIALAVVGLMVYAVVAAVRGHRPPKDPVPGWRPDGAPPWRPKH